MEQNSRTIVMYIIELVHTHNIMSYKRSLISYVQAQKIRIIMFNVKLDSLSSLIGPCFFMDSTFIVLSSFSLFHIYK